MLAAELSDIETAIGRYLQSDGWVRDKQKKHLRTYVKSVNIEGAAMDVRVGLVRKYEDNGDAVPPVLVGVKLQFWRQIDPDIDYICQVSSEAITEAISISELRTLVDGMLEIVKGDPQASVGF